MPIGVAATAQRRIGVQLWLRAIAIIVVTLSVTAGVLWRGMDGLGLALLFAAIAEGLVWTAVAFEAFASAGDCRRRPRQERFRYVRHLRTHHAKLVRRYDEVRGRVGSLTHRGPDGFGIATGRLADRRLEFRSESVVGANLSADVYLGHRRLAVVDLSKSALQPMTNETATRLGRLQRRNLQSR